jgi:hypothetical protein
MGKKHTGAFESIQTSMLCRRPSSSSIRDRRDVETTALRRRISTFDMPARTLVPASGSSSAWAPSLSSSSSTGGRGRDLRRRSVTVVVSSREVRGFSPDDGREPEGVRFNKGGARSGLRIFLRVKRNESDNSEKKHKDNECARIELRLCVIDALAHATLTNHC